LLHRDGFGAVVGGWLALEQAVDLAREFERAVRSAEVAGLRGRAPDAANAPQQLVLDLVVVADAEADEARCVSGPRADGVHRDAVFAGEGQMRRASLPLVGKHELDDSADSLIELPVRHRARRSGKKRMRRPESHRDRPGYEPG
jgi:hypothetical protein